MEITVLTLDDDPGFTDDLKILLENLDGGFFNNLVTDITKINVEKASDTDRALEILTNEKIDLILIDIELSSEEMGHDFYESLFVKGIEIPSIALSAVVDTPRLRKEILDVGISMIVKKFTGSGKSIEIRVAEAICQVLDSPEQKLLQLQTNVDYYKIGDKPITYKSTTKTIQEWIDVIARDESIEGAVEIRKIIFNECINTLKYEQND